MGCLAFDSDLAWFFRNLDHVEKGGFRVEFLESTFAHFQPGSRSADYAFPFPIDASRESVQQNICAASQKVLCLCCPNLVGGSREGCSDYHLRRLIASEPLKLGAIEARFLLYQEAVSSLTFLCPR